jgi:RNA polymerase sigma factor (TIGR02999 family)
MSEVTQILDAIGRGDQQAPEQLLPIIYQDLRRLAANMLAQEPAGQTLEATALVHEAYLRLVDSDEEQKWKHRGHFFAAAVEAMRRILVEQARRKQCVKHGGEHHRVELADGQLVCAVPSDQLLALDEALERFGQEEPDKARLVKLRFFAGLSIEEAAEALGMNDFSAVLNMPLKKVRGVDERYRFPALVPFCPRRLNPKKSILADAFHGVKKEKAAGAIHFQWRRNRLGCGLVRDSYDCSLKSECKRESAENSSAKLPQESKSHAGEN